VTATEPLETWATIASVAELVALVGLPGERAATKGRSALLPVDRDWLAATPFCVIATSDAEGRCDASPKGDPPGALVHVIDDTTIAIAERPGNKRVDGYRIVVVNPHVGINFLIPGRGDTLRINGRARLVSDAPFFDEMVVKGFLRSGLWKPETWDPEGKVPRRAVIAKEVEPSGMTIEQLDDYYDPANYTKGLYG
jgi:predicted pyridoxine 5'-phosphate oxidase superfamily flavin-nucleotide-binding protein